MPDRAATSQPSREPISPELALVDPELALRARALLPDHSAPAHDAAVERSHPPARSAPVVLRTRRSRRRLQRRLAAIVAAAAAGVAGGYVVTEATLIGDGADTSLAPAPAAASSAGGGPTVTTVEGLLAAAATPAAARALLGKPKTREAARDACRMSWPRRGLTIVYAAPNGRNACRAGDAVGVLLRKRGFASADGLGVGASLAGLRRAYPTAEARPDGWWALSGDGLLAHVKRKRVDTIYATR